MKLVLLGDFHYSAMKERKIRDKSILVQIRDDYYERMIKKFTEADGDYHISLGNLTNSGDIDELRYMCRSLKENCPDFIHVIGSNDSYKSSKEDILEETKQERYFSIDQDNIKMIFLDTTLESNLNTNEGSIDIMQMLWFEDQIYEAEGKTVLVFAHHPVYATTALSKEKGSYIKQIKEVNRILNLHRGIGVFFCGHNHINSICSRNNWYFVQTADVLDTNAFRIVDISDDKMIIDYKEFENFTDSSKVIGRCIENFHFEENAYGDIRDRFMEVNFKDNINEEDSLILA